MKPCDHYGDSRAKLQNLTAAQVSDTVERSGLTRQEFAAEVGCGTSQLYKYQQEGLPPRMNKLVRAATLERAMVSGVVEHSAAARTEVHKLSRRS